jgi:hypothetical protein
LPGAGVPISVSEVKTIADMVILRTEC